MFGKKSKQPSGGDSAPPAGGGAPPVQPPSGGIAFPWESWPDAIACNIACGDLTNNLKQPFLEEGGRLHAETYIAAAGAVAGWAAQQSLRTRATVQATTADTKDGRKFMFGDELNMMLYNNDRIASAQCVVNLVLGGAVSHGIAPADLPDVGEMFKQVTRAIGGPDEGMPSTPTTHRPALRADALLQRAIPVTMYMFTREQPHKPGPEQRLRKSSWSAVAAWSAAGVFNQVASVSPPKTAATIAIESAIYASKILEPWAVSPRPEGAPAP